MALAIASHKLSIICSMTRVETFTITEIVRKEMEVSDLTKVNREFCNPNFAIAFI